MSEPTKLYKLTNKDGTSYGGRQWGPGITHETDGRGEVCGPGFMHWYTHPLLAVLLNPIHADFKNPVLWEGEGEIAKEDHGLKVGCTKGTTIKQIPLPTVTIEQRVRFGILCALEVCKDKSFVQWANDWLSGKDRTVATAWAAASGAWVAAIAAWVAARRAWVAAEATSAATRAAEAAWVSKAAAKAAAWAACISRAAEAAMAVAEAVNVATKTDKPINLIVLAKKAVEEK